MLNWYSLGLDGTTVALTGVATAVGVAAGAAWQRVTGVAPLLPSGSATPHDAKFATLFRLSPLPLLLTAEDDGRVIDVNAAAEALAGGSAEGRGRGSVFAPGAVAVAPARHIEGAAGGAGIARREFRLRTPAGQDLDFQAHTARVVIDGQECLLTALTNTTELSRLDERLLYAQRMEGIGRLSGGVAHEFNNLLTVMQGHLDGLAAELPRALPAMRHLETLRGAVAEAAQITSGLLTFAGRNPVTATLVDANAALAELTPVLEGLLGESVRLEWDRGGAPVPVMLAQPQLTQLVLNLALNARDAMPEGGVLTVGTRRVDVDDPAAIPGPGAWVVLTITDNGHGMNDDVRRHMFEPFFTTKLPGHGTGLGLSICQGIVEQAGGHIVASSTPGHGTTIALYLPWAGAEAQPTVRPQALPLVTSDRSVILLVEDEPDVRDIVAEILRRAGHVVHGADSLAAVSALLGRGGPRPDLLLTDLMLPAGSGLDVATLVRAHYPGIPVLFMSGYSEAVFSGGEQVEHLLPKPFTAQALLAKVDEMAGRRAIAAP